MSDISVECKGGRTEDGEFEVVVRVRGMQSLEEAAAVSAMLEVAIVPAFEQAFEMKPVLVRPSGETVQ